MGSWGIRTHDSDYGLDLLGIVEERYLRSIKFKNFYVRHITELLRAHIVDAFVKESNGWESHYIDFFYEYTFPYKFAEAVMIVAECFTEYREKGKYLIHDFKSDKKRRITHFIYSCKDLKHLLTELQSVLDPKHPLCESWSESDSFSEWQLHMKTLCSVLSEAMNEGGDENA